MEDLAQALEETETIPMEKTPATPETQVVPEMAQETDQATVPEMDLVMDPEMDLVMDPETVPERMVTQTYPCPAAALLQGC